MGGVETGVIFLAGDTKRKLPHLILNECQFAAAYEQVRTGIRNEVDGFSRRLTPLVSTMQGRQRDGDAIQGLFRRR